MTIEINTHDGPVNGGLIGHLESELSRLHRMLPRLSRAEVHFLTDKEEMPHRQFVCSIAIEAYGNDFTTVSHRENWHEAMEASLAVAEKRVKELAASDREPPDEVLSTISV